MKGMSSALRDALSRTNVSLIQIEREIGVSRDSISRFLRGNQSLRLDLADRLAEYFGITVSTPSRNLRANKMINDSQMNPLTAVANALNERCSSLHLEEPKAHFFNIAKIDDHVWVQVLFLQQGGSHLEVGLAFDDNIREVNDRHARLYIPFVKLQNPPIHLDERETARLRYLVHKIQLSSSIVLGEAAKTAADVAVWFLDLPYGQVEDPS